MAYLRFFFTHPRVLSFGVLLTLFSSFGQTFLISIFVPRLLETFALSTAQFGVLYASATLLSASSLAFFGRLIDRITLRTFSLSVGAGLVLACLTLSLAPNVPLLFLGILGLRLTGQGLLSLTASTTMARVFDEGRGKALSISGLGYPLGEGLLPVAIVLLIHAVGWRWSWGILAGVIALVLLPAMASLLRRVEPFHQHEIHQHRTAAPRTPLLRDRRFYLLLPGSLYLPLVLTALFLYQIPLAEYRGWSMETMAAAFIGFAVSRMVSSLLVGPLIDRWSAVRMFPYILMPVALGLLALTLGTSPWLAFVYLTLAGISQGVASPVLTALWAEVYGVASIGATKGMVATFGILATAVGPVLLGGLLAVGVSFTTLVPACALLAVAITLLSLVSRHSLNLPPHSPHPL